MTQIRLSKKPNLPSGVISKDKFMSEFWLPLELRGLRAGNTLSILRMLCEWSGSRERQELLGRSKMVSQMEKVTDCKTALLLLQV